MQSSKSAQKTLQAYLRSEEYRLSHSKENLLPKLEMPPRLRIKNILVPIDFSEFSLKALEYAVAFAKSHQARLIILHVSGSEFYPANDEKQDAYIELHRLDDFYCKGLKTTLCVKEGDTCRQIIETAKQEKADLIVISTHGYSGFKRALLGSVTEEVVSKAGCPVLVVREKEPEFIHSDQQQIQEDQK